jgi:hypothetical protein
LGKRKVKLCIMPHTHRSLSTSELESATTNPLRPESYESRELASKLASMAGQSSEFKQGAIGFVRDGTSSWTYGSIADLQLNGGYTSDKSVLDTYFKVFNHAFFFGSLSNVGVTLHSSRREEGGLYGRCKSVGVESTHIEIYKLKSNCVRQGKLLSYLGTLLHEMVHAVFAIYACDADDCRDRSENEGAKRHGSAFQTVLRAICRAAEIELGLDLWQAYREDRNLDYGNHGYGGSYDSSDDSSD